MSFNSEELNLMVADRLGEFVKGRLLQNKAHLDNSGEFVSAADAFCELERIRSYSIYDYPVEYTKEYKELASSCAGSINFTCDEIDEIAELIKKSVRENGLGHNITYWNALSFAIRSLDKLAGCRLGKLGVNAREDADFCKAVKYKSCLQLDQMPLYYKPFACIIACGYPYSLLRIANDNNESICDISNTGEVRVDDLLRDMFLETGDIGFPKGEENLDEVISVAADWWAKAITDPTFVIRYDRNASYLSSILALANKMSKTSPSEMELEAFKNYLGEEIRAGLALNGHYTISVNYNLDPALEQALSKAKLRGFDYTWDTSMDISADGVSLAFGRGDKQVIFDAGKREREKAVQKTKLSDTFK